MAVADFESFFAAEYAGVLHAVRLATGDADRAQDMTQEAFARAYRRWPAVSVMERPVAWVYVVALNAARRSFRDSRRQSDLAPDISATTSEADAVIDAVINAVAVRELLAALPPRQRAAVVLRYLADLSVAETAAAMGCAEGTVKSAVHAALTQLRAAIGEESRHES